MNDLLLGIGLVIVGVGLFVWLRQWRRRRRQIEPPVSLRWLNDHDYHKDGHREK